MCISPRVLKSGIVVKCGKCPVCLSDRRNEWSIRLAINCEFYERMPMFLTLTYDDDNLPHVEVDNTKDFFFGEGCWLPTLNRPDISAFIKEYKRINKLDNSVFTYFGCGEYGDKFGRPHYHLLFFGDRELYDLYDKDVEQAREHVQRVWKLGNVHVGVAGFDGIHYVSKYCLKECVDELHPAQVLPFTIGSNNLGARWLESKEAKIIKSKLKVFSNHWNEVYDTMPPFSPGNLSELNDTIAYIEDYLPRFETILSDGRKVQLPRYFRRKLIGEGFSYLKMKPTWLYDHLCLLRDSIKYYRDNGDYDATHKHTAAYEACLTRLEKINRRLLERKYNKTILKK